MAFGDPKLPQATLRGENLYIEGEKEPYFRDPEYTIWLRVYALAIHRGYDPEDPIKRTGKVLTELLQGTAKVEGVAPDRFAVIGLKRDRETAIKFQLGPASESDTRFHWRANIWFETQDWQHDLDEACFWITGYCPRQCFDDLLAAIRRGHVDNIRVGMETTMWTKDQSSMVDLPRTWHVAPPTSNRESTRPEAEHGNILSLTWDEKFGSHPAKDTGDKLTAPKSQVVGLPARLYSMLGALIVIGAFTLLMLLRH
jgi:hypothetical protein